MPLPDAAWLFLHHLPIGYLLTIYPWLRRSFLRVAFGTILSVLLMRGGFCPGCMSSWLSGWQSGCAAEVR